LGRSKTAVTRGLAKETELENELLSPDDNETVSSSKRLDSLQSKHKKESPAKDDETACLDILVSCMTALLALATGKVRPSVDAMCSMVHEMKR
jgi:hypothetical protein